MAADVDAPSRASLLVHDAAAMGTTVRLALVGARSGAVERALAEVATLERRWSRFRPDSEVSTLNATGRLADPSWETRMLVAAMCEAWEATSGLADASVLAAVEALGYRDTFAALPSPDPILDGLAVTRRGAPVPGLAGVVVGPDGIRLPRGVRVDPGGIGKGLAADLVATALVADGLAAGALVSLGGDLRATGQPPDPGGWTVALEAPAGTTVRLPTGGLASSSVRRRRWRGHDGGTAHHVVDPRTGRPADTGRTDATAVAGTAWQAEALATAVLLAGPGAPEVEAAADAWHGAGLAVDEAGDLTIHDTLEAWLC